MRHGPPPVDTGSLLLSLADLMRKLAVIGAGQMGAGIAQVAAQVAKIPRVVLYDNNAAQLTRQMGQMRALLERGVVKGRVTAADRDATLSAITPTGRLEDIGDADFIIEAVVENEQVKQNVIVSVAPVLHNPATTILATNTSSISITKLAAHHTHPANFIGMHFMNPVPVMKLVEVIKGCETAASTIKATEELVARMDKVFTCSEDVPGFIANRILMPYINEAVFALYEVVCAVHLQALTMTQCVGNCHSRGD